MVVQRFGGDGIMGINVMLEISSVFDEDGEWIVGG